MIRALCLLAALWTSSASAAARVEWAPHAPFGVARSELAGYHVERRAPGAWVAAGEVVHSAFSPDYRPALERFVFEDPAGDQGDLYRVFGVDAIGNMGPPLEVFAGCSWRGLGVVLNGSCARAARVLEDARGELVRSGFVEPRRFDALLLELHALVVLPADSLVVDGRQVAGLYGRDKQGRRLVYLPPDLAAALHELFHAYEDVDGDPGDGPESHPSWDHDPRLRELDHRFQARTRRTP